MIAQGTNCRSIPDDVGSKKVEFHRVVSQLSGGNRLGRVEP